MDGTVVQTYDNQPEAEMWAELLRDAGIPCWVEQSGADIAAVGMDAWVPHTLWVRTTDIVRARDILAPPET